MLSKLLSRDPKADTIQASQDWLASLGATHPERANAIDALFQQRSKSVLAAFFDVWAGASPGDYIALRVTRSLTAMAPEEYAALYCAEHLNNLMSGNLNLYARWRAALVWGGGKGQVLSVASQGLNAADPIRDYMVKMGVGTAEEAVRAVFAHLTEVKNNPQTPDDVRKIMNALSAAAATLQAAAARPAAAAPHPSAQETSAMVSSSPFAPMGAANPMAGGLMGNTPGFLQSSAVPQTCFATKGPHAIYLGTFDDGTWLSYSDAGALVTIAPPGSGKSQCHVIPNLLQWRAPAVVLDVKGEIYAMTSKWRAANVGPVYRFAPTDTAHSHHYNPLALVSSQPDQVWQESRFLADMFIVPSASSGGGDNNFWDTNAKALVTAAIAYICFILPPERRRMSELLDVIHGGEPLKKMIVALRGAFDVPPMVRAGTSLGEMEPRTKANILSTVQTSFQAWEDVPIERVTSRCDWSPLDLRTGSNGGHPTIYICLRPHEVEAYVSLLRVFIAQHIRLLTSMEMTELDRSKILPILFLLDELPRLGRMPPVASAIEIGASYGLRIWMFAQSLGQLQEAYPNADGMISSCAVRVYLNPSGADGMAEKLSKELGSVTNMADGTQQPLVPANELAGPKWADKQLVLALGTRPGRIRKNFAYKNEQLWARRGAHR